MTFQEALVAMNEGHIVSLDGNNYKLNDRVISYIDEDDGLVDVYFSVEQYQATDWEQVLYLPVLQEDQVYMFFHPEKNRWVSTTNPQNHRDIGHRVAVFTLDHVA